MATTVGHSLRNVFAPEATDYSEEVRERIRAMSWNEKYEWCDLFLLRHKTRAPRAFSRWLQDQVAAKIEQEHEDFANASVDL